MCVWGGARTSAFEEAFAKPHSRTEREVAITGLHSVPWVTQGGDSEKTWTEVLAWPPTCRVPLGEP